jgi:hypothetical protein
LKHLYNPKMEYLLCGDLKVNYLTDSKCKFCGPLINGSSDQDAHLVILTNVFTMDRVVSKAYRTHLITTDSIYILLDTLPSESWKNVYEHAEISMTLHLLLNACLSIFESCFTIQTTTLKFNNNGWITADVRRVSVF